MCDGSPVEDERIDYGKCETWIQSGICKLCKNYPCDKLNVKVNCE